ncbi:MAG: 50S ribosome-binding GTPase [Brachybacterium sp.]|nr:50S ribosome-binding GTPase [Brachybacterium sp.]
MAGGRAPGIAERTDALERARTLLDGIAPDDALAEADAVIERTRARGALSAEHTVVGFFGATGSGKSSVMNALVGREITRAAVRRPTTAAPVAAVLGESGSDPLLDWLQVSERHLLDGTGDPLEHAARDAGGSAGIPGMVLLDLPDMDSVEASNRALAEAMTGQVDVLVWVTDPQKYADDALHADFITPFAGHDAVTVVVLNQVDALRPDERDPVVRSLGQLVRRDGLETAPVLATSAHTGEGIDELRELLLRIARDNEAAAARTRVDLTQAAEHLQQTAGPDGIATSLRPADRERLVDALAEVAQIDRVARAVGASYRYRASGHTGWPLLRWLRRFRPDPLRRLHIGLDRGEGRPGRGASGSGSTDADGVEDQGAARTSLPTPNAAATARASSGVRRFADIAAADAPDGWRAAVRRAARSHEEELPDALDQAVAGADLRARRSSWWWPLLGILQWIALLCLVVGLGWLVGLAVLGFAQIPAPPMPMIEELWVPIPVPTALVILGVAAGILVAMLGAALAGVASALARRRARRLLRRRVGDVADDLVVAPVQEVLEVGREVATDLAKAAGHRRRVAM